MLIKGLFCLSFLLFLKVHSRVSRAVLQSVHSKRADRLAEVRQRPATMSAKGETQCAFSLVYLLLREASSLPRPPCRCTEGHCIRKPSLI